MDMMHHFSDDQLALLGCAGALLAAFTVMAVSFHVGRLVRGESPAQPGLRIRSAETEAAPVPPQRRRAA